jgi:hypothetical protein
MAVYAPALATTPIWGAVSVADTGDAAALGLTPAYRVYAFCETCTPAPCVNIVSGGTVAPTCLDARCTAGSPGSGFGYGEVFPGLYSQINEDTGGPNGYCADADNKTYCTIYDAEVNAGLPNHIGYYALGCVIASNGTTNPVSGDPSLPDCPQNFGVNCMEIADSRFARSVPLSHTSADYGGTPHSIRSIDGFSPIPTVRAAVLAGNVTLSWDSPDDFAGAMNPGPTLPAPASPLLGVRVWAADRSAGGGICPPGPSGQDLSWQSIGTVNQPATTLGPIPGPPAGMCRYYALSVRFKGPGVDTDLTSEIETGAKAGAASNPGSGFVGANSQAVGGPSTAILIARVNARYAGRGTVSVTWTTGVEGGVQGFYVSRGTSPAGPFTRVSQQITPRGDGSEYSFSDKAKAGAGRVVYYQIDAVNADGSVFHSGPTAVTIPVPKKAGGMQ